jgi:hypothetical protein
MKSPLSHSQELPLTPSDGFILALDGLCKRAWGGGLLANSELEIEGQPNVDRLLWLAAKMPLHFAPLRAILKRGKFLKAPIWKVPTESEFKPIPLFFHRLESVPGRETAISSVPDLRTQLLAMRLHDDGRPPHLRLDVVRHHPSRWTLLITWSHLVLDGVGIEILIKEMARLWEDPSATIANHEPIYPVGTAWERFQESEAVGKYLFQLSGKHFPSASRGMSDKGRPQHLVETFSKEEGVHYREALKRAGGDLMTSFFHAVIAARAHRALLHSRGYKTPTLVLGVPAQLRAKNQDGEPVIFQNHMTMFYYVLEDKELDCIATACRSVMMQNIDHLRHKHHLSFCAFLSLSRHLPGLTTLHLVRWQQSGELVSLFHSWTGTVAQGLDHAFGGRIINGFHIPGVTAPPGSGLFFSDCQGLYSVVLSWVDTCLSAREIEIMRKQWRYDLLGEEAP